MLTIKKLYDDLEYWDMNQMASDIYECKSMRPEYLPFVVKAEAANLQDQEIIRFVLWHLKIESAKPWYKKDLTLVWHLIKINVHYYLVMKFRRFIAKIKATLRG